MWSTSLFYWGCCVQCAERWVMRVPSSAWSQRQCSGAYSRNMIIYPTLVWFFLQNFFYFYNWLYTVRTRTSVNVSGIFTVWASRIRLHKSEVRIRILPSSSKSIRKAFFLLFCDFFYDFFIIEQKCKCTFKDITIFFPRNCLLSEGPLPYSVKRISAWLIVSHRV